MLKLAAGLTNLLHNRAISRSVSSDARDPETGFPVCAETTAMNIVSLTHLLLGSHAESEREALKSPWKTHVIGSGVSDERFVLQDDTEVVVGPVSLPQELIQRCLKHTERVFGLTAAILVTSLPLCQPPGGPSPVANVIMLKLKSENEEECKRQRPTCKARVSVAFTSLTSPP